MLYAFFFFNMQMRSPKEVEKEQYQEFYKKAFNEFLDPLTYTHFNTEVWMLWMFMLNELVKAFSFSALILIE